jgi:hypothetical protein
MLVTCLNWASTHLTNTPRVCSVSSGTFTCFTCAHVVAALHTYVVSIAGGQFVKVRNGVHHHHQQSNTTSIFMQKVPGWLAPGEVLSKKMVMIFEFPKR